MTRPHPQATAGHRYRRPVSPTERLYLAAGHTRGAMALRILVEGNGVPDPGLLRAALAQAAEACPGSTLVRRGAVWRAEGPPPRVRYADQGAADAFDVSAPATAALLNGPAHRADPPGCEVLVVPGNDGSTGPTGSTGPSGPARPEGARTTLVFSASHALMDGHGALTWAQEVFRALRGEPARPALAPDTDHGLLRGLGATDRRPALAPDRPSPLGRSGAGPEQTLWLRRTLPGHHPAFTARLAQALTDTAGQRTRVMVPVDLRRHRPGISATGNLTLPLFLDMHPGNDWTDPHTRLLTALAEDRELAKGFETALVPLPSAVSALLLYAAQAVATRADRHLASAVVSHLGRLHLDDYSGGGFTAATAYALPVHAPLVPVSLVAAETRTATEVTMGVRGGAGLADRAARLLDGALARLTAAPKPSSQPPRPRPAHAGAGTTVVELFRAQAARTPDAIALDGPEGPVTYAELDRRSDAVARELVRRGTGREDLVGLVVDRSSAGVCALWGILKAGAAYVPLDPAHPGARIKEVLEACGTRLCLTQRHLADALAAFVPCPLLVAEDIPDAPDLPVAPDATHARDASDAPAGPPPPAPGPQDLAYVIHTSGSTGRPKGVQIEHGSLMGFVRWMTEICQITDATRFGFASSYAFDISCFPLFLPLLAGGTTVLAPDAPSRATVRHLVTEHRADTLALTPSHLALLAGGGPVRTLLLGGEPLTPAAVRTARAVFGPDCRIINGYGPTEATVACLAHVVDGSETTTSIPLGTPGPGARVDLVAEDGTALGAGEDDIGRTGEIVVSGLQVARGYLGPPDGRPSPFTTHPDGTRGYRTGDLGRRLPGGAVEFAGRIDGQLKIAGHRVEPAEIVAALEAHPAVSRAVVAARSRSDATTPVLCAYVVPRPASPADPNLSASLRAELGRRLPAHLVPAHITAVAAIPSTVSGKADLDALPDPFDRARDTAPPPPTLQARVARHWAAILGVDTAALTADADFQSLGGDSLALIEMLTAVSSDLLTEAQGHRFMSRLESLVRDVTLDQVCAHVQAAREEVPA